MIPFLIFQKYPTARSQRSIIFRGLAVPSVDGLSSTEDLVAIWRSKNGRRFQNYRALFSILPEGEISKDWLNNPKEQKFMPASWKYWVETGVAKRMQAPPISIRGPAEQSTSSRDDQKLILGIYSHFKNQPTNFEPFAARVFKMLHPSAIIDEVTRAVADGGRDAIGRLPIGPATDPVELDFALEAKCYEPPSSNTKGNSVTVSDTKRLISRLKHREFGVLVTTSYVAAQAYKEIREDGHPVIIISGADIVDILKKAGVRDENALKMLLSAY